MQIINNAARLIRYRNKDGRVDFMPGGQAVTVSDDVYNSDFVQQHIKSGDLAAIITQTPVQQAQPPVVAKKAVKKTAKKK